MKRTSDDRRIKAGEQLDDDFDIKNTPPLELVSRVLAENMHGHRWLYALAVVAMIVVAVTSAATAWIMEAIFNVLSGAENEYDSWVVSIAVMMIFALKGGASYVQQVTLTRAGSSVVAKLQRRLYAKLLMQDALWFENTDSSKILVHVTQSAGAARTVIDVIVTSVIRDALTLVGMVGVMVWQNAVLSLVFFVVMPVALLSVRVVMGRVSAVTREGFVGQAEINKVIRETSTGLRVIRSFGLERLLQVRMDSAIRDGQVRANTISRFESLTLPLMDTLAGFAIGIVIMANTFSGRVGTPASAGEIMAFITALLMAYEPAKRLSRVRVTLEAAFNGVRMMFSILDMPDAIADAPDAVDLPRGKGAVSFKNVTFAYSRKKPILNNLTLDFAPGKVTAIVGPSGGGKSTIMSLLLRVYDPKAGKITIDGFDLRHVTRASLRHVLSYAGQNTFLFSTSVRDNIRMGRENATDSEVEAAAKCAQAHDFIMALPNGYDTQVGENGIFFSGGQRQRLSLARAILKDAPVLLLDEATSALDNYSEGLVRDAITQVTTGRTTIFIAHRLSTVMVADEVMYIEAGQLVEHGPLQELLNSDTRFAALFRKERTMAKSKSDRKLKSPRSDI